MVQWLRLHVPTAGSAGSIPGQKTRIRHPTMWPKHRVRERDWRMSSAFEMMVNQRDCSNHFTIYTQTVKHHIVHFYSFFCKLYLDKGWKKYK